MDYFHSPTKTSPLFTVNRDKACIEIKGKSTPESSVQLYYPIIDRIREIFTGFKGKVTIEIGLEYFNTSSSKCLFDLLKTVKRMDQIKAEVKWYYEDGDEDMIESGEDFEDILQIPFTYIPVADIAKDIYKHQESSSCNR